jgi:aspartate racemase
MQAILPNKADQERIIHPAITDENYGIKACSHPVSERARIDLLGSVCSLVRDGAEVVVLGCTEIPLAIKEKQIEGVTIVDPTLILARALIHAVSSDKLLPLR